MEEENKQEVQPEVNQEVKNETKKVDFKDFDIKKYLPIIGVVAGVLLFIIILVSVLGGGPKKAVKKYISGISSGNVKKMYKAVDPIGTAVWMGYDEEDFGKSDYKDFLEEYEEYKEEFEENIEEYEEEVEEMIEEMEDSYDDFTDDYKSYKVKIDKFKKVEKIGKGLYVVKAKVSTVAKPKDKDDDEIDESETMTFVVYKNKIIDGASF